MWLWPAQSVVSVFLAAAAASDASALYPGAPEWLSSKVVLCGAAALGLVVFSLLLKGLQKVISLALALALVLGAFWFLRDAWDHKEKFLPPALAAQLDAVADKTLRSPQAQAAWASVQAQFTKLVMPKTEFATAASLDEKRKKVIADELNQRATTLRRAGHRSAADELNRLRDRLRE